MSTHADDYSGPAAEFVEPADLIPWEENPKKPTRKEVQRLASFIEQVGWGAPIIACDGDSELPECTIVAGHTRLLAAKLLDREAVPVRFMRLTVEQARAIMLADNQMTKAAQWSPDALREQLLALDDTNPLDLGFEEKELQRLLGREAAKFTMPSEEDMPPLDGSGGALDDEPPFDMPSGGDATGASTEARVQSGEVWQLGRHRIMCGDSTKRAEVGQLLGKRRCELMVTDPPYGVGLGAAGSAGDNLAKHRGLDDGAIHGDRTQAAFQLSLAVAIELALDANARVYMCGGSDNIGMAAQLFDHHLRMEPKIIVWVKEQFVLRRHGYHSKYELIFYGWCGKGGGLDFWFTDRKQADVWEIPRPKTNERRHPTQKPIELPARCIRNSSAPGGNVYEPFLGSGSTLIAAEKEERTCYGMELNPTYATGVVTWWQEETGEKAQRLK